MSLGGRNNPLAFEEAASEGMPRAESADRYLFYPVLLMMFMDYLKLLVISTCLPNSTFPPDDLESYKQRIANG